MNGAVFCLLTWSPSTCANTSERLIKRAETARVCQQILGKERFNLDDAIEDGLVQPLGTNLFKIMDSDIDPRETRALERLLAVSGGRALAIGTLASQKGTPVVDAIHYLANGERRLLSIKTSVSERTDGISFLRAQMFWGLSQVTRLLSKDGLAGHYRIDPDDPRTRNRFSGVLFETLLRIWDLDQLVTPQVTFLLDLTPAETLAPVLRIQADVFPNSTAARARKDDTVLVIMHEGGDETIPRVFNIDQFLRSQKENRRVAGAIILFRHHVLEVTQDAFRLRDFSGNAQSGGQIASPD